MFRFLSIILVYSMTSFVFLGVVQAEQKSGSRVIYEENTSFKDAKHRVKVLENIERQNSQPENSQNQTEKPLNQSKITEAWMEKILPLMEKFLGADGAALLNAYKKGPAEKNDAVLGGQTEKGLFREFSDKYQWKGLRREEPGNSAQ